MNKNLFAISTPFHALTVFILSKTVYRDDENYVVILHPQGYEAWGEEPLLEYISSEKCGYKKVFPYLRWFRSGQGSLKKQAQQAKKEMGDIGFDRFFLAVDIDEQAQLLFALLGAKGYYRFDDGLGSYGLHFHKRNSLKAFFHMLKMRWSCFISGISPQFHLNSKAMNSGVACCGEYIYRPELLLRSGVNAKEITGEMIQTALTLLKVRGFLKPRFDRDTFLFLGEPSKRGEEVEEINFLRNLLRGKGDDTQFLFKPHAREEKSKIKRYVLDIPELEIFQSKIPVELFCAAEPNLTTLISYSSSALLFAEKFAGRKMHMVSTFRGSGSKKDEDIQYIFDKANIEFAYSV